MTAQRVLAILEAAGVEVFLDDAGTLKLRAPTPPPDDLVELAREHKPALLALFTGEAPRPYLDARGDLVVPFGTPPQLCWWMPGGRRIADTLDDLGAEPEIRTRYEPLH